MHLGVAHGTTVLFAIVGHGQGREPARAALERSFNDQFHGGCVVDLEVQAGVPPTGLPEGVEDGSYVRLEKTYDPFAGSADKEAHIDPARSALITACCLSRLGSLHVPHSGTCKTNKRRIFQQALQPLWKRWSEQLQAITVKLDQSPRLKAIPEGLSITAQAIVSRAGMDSP